MSGLITHLFPPFDAVWPNLVASISWSVPALAVHHWLLRRHFRNKTLEMFRDLLDGVDDPVPPVKGE